MKTRKVCTGLGQVVSEDGNEAEAMSKITRDGAEKIVVFVYELAREGVRGDSCSKLTSLSRMVFSLVAREVGERYPDIESAEMIVDNCCMQLVMNRISLTLSLTIFGDILSTYVLVLSVVRWHQVNIGEDCAIFEAVHGSAPDIAGKNLANPTSVILAAAQMLEYLNMGDKAEKIRAALKDVIESGDRTTRDLGGEAGTTEFTQALLDRL